MEKKKVLFRVPIFKAAVILGTSLIVNFLLCYYYSFYYQENLYSTLWLNFMIQPIYFILLFSSNELNKLEIVRFKSYNHYFKKRFYEQLGLVLIYFIYLFISMYLIHRILSAELDVFLLLRYLCLNGLLFVYYNCLYIYFNYIGKRSIYELFLIVSFILQMLFSMYIENLRFYLFMSYPLYLTELNSFQIGSVLILCYLSVYWISGIRIKDMGN